MTERACVQTRFGRTSRLLLFILALSGPVFAQNESLLDVQRSRATGNATFVTSKDGGPISTQDEGGVASTLASPEQFLDRLGRLFGVTDRTRQLVASGVERDLFGQTHSKFKQVHNGVPVFSGQLRIHQDVAGRVLAANGQFQPIPEKLSVRPSLTADEAAARAAEEFETLKPGILRSELTIVDPGWYGDPPIGARLAYLVELEDPATSNAEAFFIDAQSGKTLDRWTLVERFRNRQIFDGRQTTDLPGFIVRGENGSSVPGVPDVDRAFHYYGDTYDYFWRAFGRDSMDGNGLAMVATVNSTAPGCPNAFWSSSRRQMAFCVGTVTDDITAHELTHGVTFFTAELVYQNQSGQLNESYSDVFGELVDLFNGNAAFALDDGGPAWPVHPVGPGLDQLNSLRTECSPNTEYYDGVRWLIGEDSFAFGGALRDMWDPTCHYDPDRAYSSFQTCGPGDNGGVHSGSGIPNHAFAMLVDGKEFNGFSVRGIGPIKAGAVWYRALTTYLNPTSDFEDAYHAMNQAAHDLVGKYPLDPRTGFPSFDIFSGDDAIQVDRALRAVEMNGPGRCGQTVPIVNSAPPPTCGGEVLLFSDDFESGAPGWTVNNSAPLTPYDWRLNNRPLPYGRPGTAWVCDDPELGDCIERNESGSHSLISPPIEIPRSNGHTLLRFTHHVNVETGWDGGVVGVRVNDGRWQTLPGSSFHYNSYNMKLRQRTSSNANPLGGNEAWSGIGGEWGTSVADLSGLVKSGDTLQVRFVFGKDGCSGRLGWFVDDVEVYSCPDCNFNGYGDDVDLKFRYTSGALSDIGAGSPQRIVVNSPPPSSEDVALKFEAVADLAGELGDESLFVSLNGDFIGEIFVNGASDCSSTPNTDEIILPRERFNLAALNGEIILDISATDAVNPQLCGGSSWVRVNLAYRTTSADQNANQIPDECEGCQSVTRPAAVMNSVPMNRYVPFTPNAGTRHLAYRIQRMGQPSSSANLDAIIGWIGPPIPSTESDGSTSYHARVQCAPYFSGDWNSPGPIYITGDFVSPQSTYSIDAIDLGCWSVVTTDGETATQRDLPAFHFSKPLSVHTAVPWGDIAGQPESGGPDGSVDMLDVSAVVERFKNQPGAVEVHRADLAPATPDGIVDFSDISEVLDAFRGKPYPFPVTAPDCAHRTPPLDKGG